MGSNLHFSFNFSFKGYFSTKDATLEGHRCKSDKYRFAIVVEIQYEDLQSRYNMKIIWRPTFLSRIVFFAPFLTKYSIVLIFSGAVLFWWSFLSPLSLFHLYLCLSCYIFPSVWPSFNLRCYIHLRWLRRSSFHCEYDAHCRIAKQKTKHSSNLLNCFLL